MKKQSVRIELPTEEAEAMTIIASLNGTDRKNYIEKLLADLVKSNKKLLKLKVK